MEVDEIKKRGNTQRDFVYTRPVGRMGLGAKLRKTGVATAQEAKLRLKDVRLKQ